MPDEVNVDLTNYKDRVGARIKPGRYRVLVEDAEVDSARGSGNTMINLWLRVMGGDFESSTIVDRLVITEKSLFRVVGFMQALGMPTPKKRLRINVRTFIGKQLDVDVEDGDPYNGRVKSEVRGYYRIEKAIENGAVPDLADLEGLDEFTPEGSSNDESGFAKPVEVTPPADVDLDALELG